MRAVVSKSTQALDRALTSAINAIPKRLATQATVAGKYLEDQTKETINMQEFKPIVEWWRAQKAKEGFDTRILFRAHILFHMIRSQIYEKGANSIRGGVTVLNRTYPIDSVLLKVPRRRRVMRSRRTVMSRTSSKFTNGEGKTTLRIAQYHEEGIGRNPRRPFFEQTYKREAKNIVKMFEDAFLIAIRRLL